MRHQEKKPAEILEQATSAMHADQPLPEVMEAAGERVWQGLSAQLSGPVSDLASIHGCDDVRTLLPNYRSGTLAPARALLVEDHLRGCVACRKEAEAGPRTPLPWKQELPQGGFRNFRWVAAAAVLLVAAISAYLLQDKFFTGPDGFRAQVVSASGPLYRVADSGEQLLQPGEQIGEGELVRTAAGSRAKLRLRDGSLVEMNERAQFSVALGYRDTTIHLDRGDIIVQAAKRKTGHLYVAARDCRVSVTGTVFSVNSGIKGSRVSVIEGEVRVASMGVTTVLHPGEQVASNESVSSVPVQQEIAWSEDRDKHLALMAEFAHLGQKLEQVQMPGLRYESSLLPLLPPNTVVYAGIPNLGDSIHQARELFQQELQESPVLAQWWQQAQANGSAGKLEQSLDKVQNLSQYLGNEILFTVGHSDSSNKETVLIVAAVRGQGLKEFIQQELARHGKSNTLVLDEQELMNAQPNENTGFVILVRPDLVAASGDIAELQKFAAAIKNGGGFAATPFGQKLAARYQNGAGLLLGADLARLEQNFRHDGTRQNTVFDRTGLADLQYLIAERKELSGQTYNHAELNFSGPRHGLASWLGAPAPIGGLDYISKDAAAVGSFVAKNPSQMLDDALAIALAADPGAQSEVDKLESELNIHFHQDLAATLGGEITVALDGPVLPTPSWRVIVEVYDPVRLQSTLQKLVEEFNAKSALHHSSGDKLRLEQESSGGLTYYTLSFTNPEKPVEITYTFTDGYMILAPNRAMVKSAIHVHQSGNSLASSGSFHSLMPQDGHANVSALLYQNLGPVVGPVLQQLSPSQQQSLQQLAAETKPSVVCAYGDESAIEVASNSRFFGLDLNTMVLSTLMKIAHPPQYRGARGI
jgi:hypothetical protein